MSEENKEKTSQSIPENVKILPFSFGFEYDGRFIQGTMFHDTKTRNAVGIMGFLPDGREYSDVGDLAQKLQWNQDTLKPFVEKVQGIFSKQQANQFK